MIVVRNLPLNGLLVLFSYYALGQAAIAADATEFDRQALVQVLDQATYVVRGRPVSSHIVTASSGENYKYVRFKITEVLKGAVSDTEIEVRQLAGPEQSDYDGIGDNEPNDVIVALGARNTTDGSYSAAPGFTNGEYTVESDQDGDWVLVNALGVDASSVSPKDVHRKVANGRVPIDIFRRISKAGDRLAAPSPGAGAAGRVQPGPALAMVPSRDLKSSGVAQMNTRAAVESGSDRGQLWKAIAAVCAAIAIGTWLLLKRINTSRRK